MSSYDIMKNLQGAIEFSSDLVINERTALKILEKIKKEPDPNDSYILTVKLICEFVIEKSITADVATQKIKTMINNYFSRQSTIRQ